LKKVVVGEPIHWAECAAKAAQSKKASEVVIINVKPTLVILDYFIVATADNALQFNAVIEAVEDALRENCGLKPIGREGVNSVSWVLLDYGDIVVHVFNPTTRDFYRLETLYNDAEQIKYDN